MQCRGIWAANKKIALSMHFCDEFFNFMIFERGSKPLCSSTLKSFTVAFSKFPKRSICVLLYLISRDVLWGKQIKLYHAVKALGSFNKVENIWSHHLHLQWKFKLWARKFTWGNKAKHYWGMSTKFLLSKVCLPLHLKQTFLPIIWIFTEDEGDGIESRLPFKIFSTL